ncbi:MAG: hypothetical protein RQ715_11490 [Methylococcales bacterium]|nr:hypothetical protein [Methylococcales bacterium]
MKQSEYNDFLPQRHTIWVRGLALTGVGLLLTFFSLLKPDVYLLSGDNSWLPLIAIVIMITGFMEGLDALLFRQRKEFYLNLQFAVFDTVFGLFFLTELNKTTDKIMLLAAAFLVIKGLFRLLGAYMVRFPNHISAIVGGAISIFLGVLLWQEWPFKSLWFICVALSLDLATRGWALYRFGVWLKQLGSPKS